MRQVTLGIVLLLMTAGNAKAIPIGGIEFPDGAVSFADAVVSFAPGADVGAGWDNPLTALGVPGGGAVSLGEGGSLILRFIDNALTTSGTATPDVHIFEIGDVVEIFNLSISTNGIDWVDLGNVLGQPTSVNIDGVAGVVSGALYTYVRLIDVAPGQSGFPFGEADIDAVGAISSVTTTVPEPVSLSLLGTVLLGLGFARGKVRRS